MEDGDDTTSVYSSRSGRSAPSGAPSHQDELDRIREMRARRMRNECLEHGEANSPGGDSPIGKESTSSGGCQREPREPRERRQRGEERVGTRDWAHRNIRVLAG